MNIKYAMIALGLSAGLHLQAQDTPPPAEADIIIEKRVEPSTANDPTADAFAQVGQAIEQAVQEVVKKVESFDFDKMVQPILAQVDRVERRGPRPPGEPPHIEHEEHPPTDNSFVLFGNRPTQSRALIVRSTPPEEKELDTLQEELAVMARILEKNLDAKAPHQQAMGIGVWALEGVIGRPPRNLYIEGHGAIFMVEPGFPLMAPGETEPVKETKEETSSAWEEARRELYGPKPNRFNLGFDGKGRAYDAGKVERLRERTIESLRHAVHIQRLKEEDYITVVFTGPKAAALAEKELELREVEVNEPRQPGVRRRLNTVVARGPENPGSQTTTMTIRAQMKDVHAFAKDNLSLDDFRKRVKIAVY